MHEPVDQQRQLSDELAGGAFDGPAADLDRHRAVLEDEQSRALLTGIDQDVPAVDLERRRDVRDVCQREVVEIGEQRLTAQRIDHSGSPHVTAARVTVSSNGCCGVSWAFTRRAVEPRARVG